MWLSVTILAAFGIFFDLSGPCLKLFLPFFGLADRTHALVVINVICQFFQFGGGFFFDHVLVDFLENGIAGAVEEALHVVLNIFGLLFGFNLLRAELADLVRQLVRQVVFVETNQFPHVLLQAVGDTAFFAGALLEAVDEVTSSMFSIDLLAFCSMSRIFLSACSCCSMALPSSFWRSC